MTKMEGRGTHRLSGPEGLILAAIHQSAKDAVGMTGVGQEHYQESALAYFAGSTYRHHLELLGIPGSWLPDILENQHEEA